MGKLEGDRSLTCVKSVRGNGLGRGKRELYSNQASIIVTGTVRSEVIWRWKFPVVINDIYDASAMP